MYKVIEIFKENGDTLKEILKGSLRSYYRQIQIEENRLPSKTHKNINKIAKKEDDKSAN